ncbi:hypothetical protein ACH19I_08620 [Yersinia kristensenii]|uniref:hypothetical protein n=1 Tax=Yersinia kristensenii TaxID=28152 RepID=UPI0038969397
MNQPPKGAGAHPCGIPRFARIACPLRGFPHSSFRLTDGFIRIPAHDAATRRPWRVALPTLFTRRLKCAFNIKVKIMVFGF